MWSWFQSEKKKEEDVKPPSPLLKTVPFWPITDYRTLLPPKKKFENDTELVLGPSDVLNLDPTACGDVVDAAWCVDNSESIFVLEIQGKKVATGKAYNLIKDLPLLTFQADASPVCLVSVDRVPHTIGIKGHFVDNKVREAMVLATGQAYIDSFDPQPHAR